mgnify:CR=1 FL=1
MNTGLEGKYVIKNNRCHLSAFFTWMLNEELINKNPCANIKPIKYVDKVRKPFSSLEIDALRGACKNNKERAIWTHSNAP